MRVFCATPLIVDSIDNDVDVWMLLVEVTECDELIIVVTHATKIFKNNVFKFLVRELCGVMRRESQNKVSDRFLCSATQFCMHDETINDGLIVRQVDAFTCCH